jgi:uncharacterized protein with GYD domain
VSLYILATRVAGSSLHTPGTFERLEHEVMNRVREECPEIDWLHTFAVCGPHDYIDVLDAPSLDVAMKASVLVRTYGHADTELWPALSWKEFKKLVHKLPNDEESSP